jgi:hypothetical protein
VEIERVNFLLGNPSKATNEDIILINNEIDKYPYAQILHILLAKIQDHLDSESKQKSLTTAAIYSSDRSVLKKVIQDSNFLENIEEIAPYQELPVFEIDENYALDSLEASEYKEDSESSSIFDEVLKNLEKLKSLRQQFQFLELNEPEKVSNIKPETKQEETTEDKEKVAKKVKTSKSNEKKKKQEEILAKDELLDSQVNVFFLREIEKKQESIPKEESDKHVAQKEIIEKFIQQQPSIGSIKKEMEKSMEEINKDLSEKSTKFGDDLVSENLAIILLKQGKKERAIDIYKKLIWKLPQKKAYFAARIEEINK